MGGASFLTGTFFFFGKESVGVNKLLSYLKLRPKTNNCLVVLHNFFWEGAGGWIFFKIFFFKSKSKLHGIIASISPNKGANKSTLSKNIFIQV